MRLHGKKLQNATKNIPLINMFPFRMEAMGREVKTKIPLLRHVLTVAPHGTARRSSTPINGIL